MPELENESGAGLDVRTDAELDALADAPEKGTNRERPMKDEPEKGAAPAQATKAEEYEFVHKGKPVKATREQLIKWAQMGYDRPQAAREWNAEKAKWEAERQKYGVYQQIDAYANQNPEWWNHIMQGWTSRGQNPGAQQVPGQVQTPPTGQDPYAEKFQALEAKLSKFEEAERKAQEKAEDEKLDKEIRSTREQYPDLDWDSLDENGKSLEIRVMEHAQSIGTQSFRAAMRDLLHDDLVNRAATQGKLAVAKGIQSRTKLGVLGESPTPTKGIPPRNRDIRRTSYEDLEAEIREELRSARH